MNAWTPGPWREGPQHRIEVGTPGGGAIVIVSENAIGDYRNRRLILLAPEMVEALRAFHQAACDVLAPMSSSEIKEHWQDEILDKCRKTTRALLARLEGGGK